MASGLTRHWVLGGTAAVCLIVGCGRFSSIVGGPSGDADAPGTEADGSNGRIAVNIPIGMAPVTQGAGGELGARPMGPQTAVVRRGTIAEQITLTGRVGGDREVAITFPKPGRVESVLVKAGELVAAGQLLALSDARDIEKGLNAARLQLETSILRLGQTETQARARQTGEQLRQQDAAAEAEAALRRALADQAQVKAGASRADLQTAEAAVLSAQADLDRAVAEQAQVTAGANPAQLRPAQQQLAAAQQALQQAQADQARIARGATPSEMRDAEQQLAVARQALQQAQIDQARAARGAASAEVRDAEQQLATARVALGRAEAEWARLTRGPDPAEVQTAEAELAGKRLEQQRAQVELERVTTGPPPAEFQAAQRTVEVARAGLRAARASNPTDVTSSVTDVRVAELAFQDAQDRQLRLLEGSSAGPVSPDALRAADRDLERARVALRAAQESTRVTVNNARTARDAAIVSAQAALDEAQQRQARLLEGPKPDAVEAAQLSLQAAELGVQNAEERRARVLQGPDPLGVEAANNAVQAARAGFETAEAKLRELQAAQPADRLASTTAAVDSARALVESAQAQLEALQAGPPADRLASTTAAVDSARALVESAQAQLEALQAGPPADRLASANAAVDSTRIRLASASERFAALRSHPTPTELREADDRVAAARAARDRTRAGGESALQAGDSDAIDALLLRRNVEQDRTQIATFEEEFAATRLLAPFSGQVAAVQIRAGDPFEAGTTALFLAPPGTPVVRVEPSTRNAARLAVGQAAVVEIDGVGDGPLPAWVSEVADGTAGSSVAVLQVAWPSSPALLGAPAQVVITVQRRDDALIVPAEAIRSSGARRLVEYLDGTSRRIADVEVGIGSQDYTEIVRGLQEGQVILVRR